MPDWKERLRFCTYKAQESGALQRLPEKTRENQRRSETYRAGQPASIGQLMTNFKEQCRINGFTINQNLIMQMHTI